MKPEHIIATMRSRAGITAETVSLVDPDEQFVAIVEAMKDIHRGKSFLYGNYIETHGSDPTLFALMEHFADVKRKYVRADNFMKMIMDGKNMSTEELFDTYSDLAVYAAMGIQLLIHLGERNQNEPTSSPGILYSGKQPGGGESVPDDLIA